MAWNCYRPGWAEMGHGQSTLAKEEKLQICRTQKASTLYLSEKPYIQTPADQTWGLIADGAVYFSQWGETWGLRSWILIGCGEHIKLKAYSCEREKDQKVNRLDSRFAELHSKGVDSQQLHSDKEIYQGKGLLTTQGWETIQLSTCWKVH